MSKNKPAKLSPKRFPPSGGEDSGVLDFDLSGPTVGRPGNPPPDGPPR
ncbi:hypothetical protein [Sinomonas gamaensis]|nr:hypothetical protein [Sinomonas gamaensis]